MQTQPTFQAHRYDPTNPAHDVGIHYVFRSLRPEELYECAAVDFRPVDMVVNFHLAGDRAEIWLLYHNGMPVFVWGVTIAHPGVYGLWGFGTKDTRRAMPAITRWGMKTWLPDFTRRTNPRRIEVRIPISSTHSLAWLRKLGLEVECTLPNYSVHGEDFFQLATPREYFKNVLLQTTKSSSSGAASSHTRTSGSSENECGYSNGD